MYIPWIMIWAKTFELEFLISLSTCHNSLPAPFFQKKKFDYFERIKINQFERISRTRQNYNKIRAFKKKNRDRVILYSNLSVYVCEVPPRDLNPGSCPSHLINTYICGVTFTPKVRGSKKNNILTLHLGGEKWMKWNKLFWSISCIPLSKSFSGENGKIIPLLEVLVRENGMVGGNNQFSIFLQNLNFHSLKIRGIRCNEIGFNEFFTKTLKNTPNITRDNKGKR